MNFAADAFVGASLAGAVYEIVALASGATPPITTLARRWRAKRNPLLLLVVAVWAGLGWHLFLQP